MIKIKYSNRDASKIRRKLEKTFPMANKTYNMDLMQKYYSVNIINGKNRTYPSHRVKGGLTRDIYLIIRNDIVRVNNTKKPKVFKYYRKLNKAFKEGNVRVANSIIQDIYSNGCYFSYEFSRLIRSEFLNTIKNNYDKFDNELALKLILQVTYKTELEIINNLSKLYYKDKEQLNQYLKQVIMEIKLSEDGKEKLCVDYNDFSI